MAQRNNNRDDEADYNDEHYLVELREVPSSLEELRKELAFHSDITEKAQHGKDFEECLGIIALCLDIALDGMYDVGPLCEVLVEALRNKRFHFGAPHLRAKGLIDAELVESADSLEIVRRDRNVSTILPESAIVVDVGLDVKKKPTPPLIYTDVTETEIDSED